MNILSAWAEFMIASGSSPATVGTRLRSIASLMKSAGVTDPLRLNRGHVLTWLAQQGKQWTKVTYWMSAHTLDQWVREFDLGQLDLVKGIPKPKTPDPVARPISDEEIDALLALNLRPRPAAYVRLGLFEALRVHEIAKVDAADFDWSAGWLMVTGKGGIRKPVPIHEEIYTLADRMPEVGYWFPSHTSAGHVSPIAVSQTIGAALRAIGSKATAHQLRDTAATRVQQEVKDIRITQAFMRHKTLASTMKYTAVNDAALKRAVRKLKFNRPVPIDDIAA